MPSAVNQPGKLNFGTHGVTSSEVITPSDTNDIGSAGGFRPRGFKVETTDGDVTLMYEDGQEETIAAVVGDEIARIFKRVKATGTTAVGIRVLY